MKNKSPRSCLKTCPSVFSFPPGAGTPISVGRGFTFDNNSPVLKELPVFVPSDVENIGAGAPRKISRDIGREALASLKRYEYKARGQHSGAGTPMSGGRGSFPFFGKDGSKYKQ